MIAISKCDQASDLWQQQQMTSKIESHQQDIVCGGGSGQLVSILEKQLVLFDWSSISGVIDVKIDRFFLEEESSFKILGWSFSFILGWGSYVASVAKTASKKIGALIIYLKFLFSKVDLYLCKSTTGPCLEYCCHV